MPKPRISIATWWCAGKADQSGSPLLATDLAALGHYLLGQFRCLEAEPFLREALALDRRPRPTTGGVTTQ